MTSLVSASFWKQLNSLRLQSAHRLRSYGVKTVPSIGQCTIQVMYKKLKHFVSLVFAAHRSATALSLLPWITALNVIKLHATSIKSELLSLFAEYQVLFDSSLLKLQRVYKDHLYHKSDAQFSMKNSCQVPFKLRASRERAQKSFMQVFLRLYTVQNTVQHRSWL